ncbi:MAG: F0F1 ATP synthase subunit A [Deltaproteobacteria bacterium]|jgi:F-type H+-transporting ATPase subunit a|nr:F0F1 ATP synthase subunit A [Deltaproteobacteria bacterium]
MEHPVMLLVWILEKLGLGHFAHEYPHLVYTWFFALVLITVGRLATRKVSMIPGPIQNFFEAIIEAISKFQDSMMGRHGRPFLPLMATLMIFVFFCNFNGLIPGSFSPTSNLNTTLALALVIFGATHITGIRTHGFRYIKHFLGPAPAIAPLMFPVEIISHLARVLSLSLRLFGNVMGEDLVIALLFSLVGQYFLPLPMMFLGTFTGFLQAFIMTLLAMVYVNEALEHSH